MTAKVTLKVPTAIQLRSLTQVTWGFDSLLFAFICSATQVMFLHVALHNCLFSSSYHIQLYGYITADLICCQQIFQFSIKGYYRTFSEHLPKSHLGQEACTLFVHIASVILRL